MRTYTLIPRSPEGFTDMPLYLRQVNPLQDNPRLISKSMYEEHERLFAAEALPVLNPVKGKETYTADELEIFEQGLNAAGKWVMLDKDDFYYDAYQKRQIFHVKPQPVVVYQDRVAEWVTHVFGTEKLNDKIERAYRFMEEALELGQAAGLTREEVHRIAVYVFGRDKGVLAQEIGGVMVTLAGLGAANGIDILESGETELSRIWENVEEIKIKQQYRITPPLNILS